MSIEIVLQQMFIIFILIMIGAVLFRKSMISGDTSKQISGLITNLCNPALLICSAFTDEPKISGNELLTGAFLVILAYAALIICSYLIPYILRIPRDTHYVYRLLTIYGNVGFIGIPLASAVLGPSSLIYVSLNNLVYNILIYTHGISTIKKAAIRAGKTSSASEVSHTAGHTNKKQTEFFRLLPSFKKLVNVGTVSALLTIILYVSDIWIPILLSDTLNYVGRSTTFLSMLVLGVSVARMPFRDIFSTPKLYLYAGLRLLVVPITCILLFRLITDNALIINTTALMLAVPAGNMPLIFSQNYDLDSSTIAKGIILSTLLSLLTIPVVTLFVR